MINDGVTIARAIALPLLQGRLGQRPQKGPLDAGGADVPSGDDGVLQMAARRGQVLQGEEAEAQVPLGDGLLVGCLLYTSPSPRDRQKSRMPSSA